MLKSESVRSEGEYVPGGHIDEVKRKEISLAVLEQRDTNKAQSNLEKHNVRFEEAAEVFLDPFDQFGDATANNEQRDFIIGYSLEQRLLLVVYVERGKRTRIISARLATRVERKLYEQG